jgi:hypothetical protein
MYCSRIAHKQLVDCDDVLKENIGAQRDRVALAMLRVT